MPTGDRNVLSGFLAVDGDAGSAGRQEVAGLRQAAPARDDGRDGQRPGQVYNDMRTSTVTSNDASLGRQLTLAQFISTTSSTGASVIFGNQLTLPVGGGLLYVQPIYVQARSTRFGHLPATRRPWRSPSATRSPGRARSTRRSTTSSAVRRAHRPATPGRHPAPTPAPGGDADADTVGHRDAAPGRHPGRGGAVEGAQGRPGGLRQGGGGSASKGDFAAYGQAQAKLKEALERAVNASPRAAPTATP